MEFIGEVIGWFADPASWSGNDGVPARLGEHLVLSVVPLLLALVVGLPLGILVGHTGRGAAAVVNLANIGRAVPSLAILIIAFQLVLPPLVAAGLRREAAEVATGLAMLALAVPPLVTNSYVGIADVDRDLIEAGRGMGMSGAQVLRAVELPLAIPLILAGVRTAAVQVVATATLGAVVGTGGFGRYIVDGIAQRRHEEVFAGALLVALLSIATELLFGALQARAAPRGVRGGTRPEVDRVPEPAAI
ncbi:MAG TPA: ABC transporter permease [Candidatus Limnocylindria bacterium]|nr:ABC transporter permease [Candidatus Limnocylindria bacterium]